jgi:hypothetical protein
MANPILSALLPDVPLGPPGRRVASAALLLFPVALLAGFFLLVRTEPRPAVPVTLNPAQAIETARAFAIREGIPAQGWKASYGWGDEKSLLKFVNRTPAARNIWGVAPPVYINVTLKDPASSQSARVSISLDRRVIGLGGDFDLPRSAPLPDAEALQRAEAELPSGVQFGPPTVESHNEDKTYTFRSSQISGVEVKDEIHEHGSRIASISVGATPEHEGSDEDVMQDVLILIGCLFASLVTLFSIYRYAMRAMQREVSHRRSMIVALLCGAFCCLIASNATTSGDASGVPIWALLLGFGLAGVAGGLFLAAAYGSGEGDVREAYPGKLTSLDALLTGQVFSRNVGISLIFGAACSGWVVFLLALAMTPFRSPAPRGSDQMLAPFAHNGLLIGLVVYPLAALALSAAGLLQPLAFLQRYLARARRWHLPFLVLCSAMVSVIHGNTASNAEFLMRSGAVVMALLVPFFLRDLLATLVCVSSLLFVLNLVSMVVTMPAGELAPWVYVFLAIVIFLGAGACVRYGKSLTEEQVRPVYARHIAQRKALEAEVSAAREAQLRLMPQSVPEMEGLSIAASCIPAETVGGDFYDFFHLPDGRLGVFIAEGNNRGLAAALTIALAKGYLMQCVDKVREPADILMRLETALCSILGTSAGLTEFAFATIDTVRGEIRYARTGVYPKVLLASARAPLIERLVPVEGRREPIASGSAKLEPGDHVLLFTDGIGRRLESPEKLRFDRTTGAEEARKRIMAVTKRTSEPDDLTVVVVQVTSVGAAAWEGVA